jgi:hypothetical protein
LAVDLNAWSRGFVSFGAARGSFSSSGSFPAAGVDASAALLEAAGAAALLLEAGAADLLLVDDAGRHPPFPAGAALLFEVAVAAGLGLELAVAVVDTAGALELDDEAAAAGAGSRSDRGRLA